MKKLILILTLLLAPFFLFSQSKKNIKPSKEQILKDVFYKLEQCYVGEINGEKMGLGQLVEQYEYCTKQIEKYDALFRTKYPVYFDLTNHMRASLDSKDPTKACLALKQALANYEKIDELSLVKAQGLKIDYEDKFGISLALIKKFFSSKYCINTRITIEGECGSKKEESSIDESKSEEEPVEEVQPVEESFDEISSTSEGNITIDIQKDKSSINNLNIQAAIYDTDPIILLRRAISLGLLNSEYFEIKEMIPGDSRILPGVNGVPYEFKLKNANTKEVIYFEPAEFSIDDKRNQKDNSRWEEYSKAISELKTLILTVLDLHGNSAFQIYVQGGADSPTFVAKQLPIPFNTKFFKEIELLKVNPVTGSLSRDTVYIGETYDNEELPDLRGAFAKNILIMSDRISEYDHKISIIKGLVKEFPDTTERNCTMYIYIDWKQAEKKSIKKPEKLVKNEKDTR